MLTVYGIRNCNTMKKAFAWLDEHGVDYAFHDYKKQGLDRDRVEQWLDQAGWESLINKRGMTWRRLAAETRDNMDRETAIEVMLDNPSIIRRPLIEREDGEIMLGFDQDRYQETLGQPS